MLFGLGDTTLEWGLGVRLLSLRSYQWPITGRHMYKSGFGCCLGGVTRPLSGVWERASFL